MIWRLLTSPTLLLGHTHPKIYASKSTPPNPSQIFTSVAVNGCQFLEPIILLSLVLGTCSSLWKPPANHQQNLLTWMTPVIVWISVKMSLPPGNFPWPSEFRLVALLFFSLRPHCMACRILVPLPGIKPGPPAVEAQSPNHWTTREFPSCPSYVLLYLFYHRPYQHCIVLTGFSGSFHYMVSSPRAGIFSFFL